MIQSKWAPPGHKIYYRVEDGSLRVQVEKVGVGTIAEAHQNGRAMAIQFDDLATNKTSQKELTGWITQHLTARLDGRI